MTRIRRHGPRPPLVEDRTPLPKRPYRDSAIFYAVLTAVLVAVAYATAGNVLRALVFGTGFFVIATTWSWWRFRQKLEQQRLA